MCLCSCGDGGECQVITMSGDGFGWNGLGRPYVSTSWNGEWFSVGQLIMTVVQLCFIQFEPKGLTEGFLVFSAAVRC